MQGCCPSEPVRARRARAFRGSMLLNILPERYLTLDGLQSLWLADKSHSLPNSSRQPKTTDCIVGLAQVVTAYSLTDHAD